MRPCLFASALTLLCAAAAQSLAQPCEIPEQFRLGGLIRDAVAAGDYTFVATDSGIQIVPHSGPNASQQANIIPLTGARGVAINGATLYVSTFDDGLLHAIDVSNAPAYKILASVPIGSPTGFCYPAQVRVRNGLAALNDGCHVHLFDISQPESPKYLSRIPAPTALQIDHFELFNDSAVVMSQLWMWTYDLSDPALPRPLTVTMNPFDPFDTLADDDLLYMSTGFLMIVDMSDPQAPVTLSNTAFDVPVSVITKAGTTLFATDSNAAIARIDVSTPALPQLIDHCCPDSPQYSFAIPAASGPYVSVTSYHRSRVFDTTNNALDLTASTARTSYADALAVKERLALASSHVGVTTLRVEDDGRLTPLDAIPLSLNIHGERSVALIGDRGLAAGGGSILIIDIGDPEHLTLLSTTPMSVGAISRLESYGDTVFVQPVSTQPALVRRLSGDALEPIGTIASRDLAVSGDVLYTLETRPSGQVVVARDPTDPQNLPEIGAAALPAHATLPWEELRIDGNFAYALRSGLLELAVIDFSTPHAPHLVGIVPLPASLQGFAGNRRVFDVHEDVVYLVSHENGADALLWAIDVSDTSAPVVLALRDIPNSYELRPRSSHMTPSGLLIGHSGLYHFDFVTCPCPADLDGDGLIDFADLNLVIAAFNTAPSDPNYNPAADTNGDNVIDFADLNVVLASFNSEC